MASARPSGHGEIILKGPSGVITRHGPIGPTGPAAHGGAYGHGGYDGAWDDGSYYGDDGDDGSYHGEGAGYDGGYSGVVHGNGATIVAPAASAAVVAGPAHGAVGAAFAPGKITNKNKSLKVSIWFSFAGYVGGLYGAGHAGAWGAGAWGAGAWGAGYGHGVAVRGPHTVPAVVAGPAGKIVADGLYGVPHHHYWWWWSHTQIYTWWRFKHSSHLVATRVPLSFFCT